MAGLERVTPPAVEPLSLAEARLHLRLDDTAEDTIVAALIVAARQMAEQHLRRALITQGFRLWLDAWPLGRRALDLPRPPLAAVSAVATYDEDGDASVLDPASWLADVVAVPGRLVLRAGAATPFGARAANAIAIDYEAGYGPAATDVPEPIRRGMALLLGHLFESREAGGEGLRPLPLGVEALWAPYRVVRL
ncbi:phage head-tail connector protein [Zavarzinia compransoris]|uniref:head-tail connector protein n=1 Tax=Zavarzinia marina TaxID=2911065 RepID=UPI001F38B4DC|nr:phage head-tail connector protein [Zavarzinia marina]MCF4166478.1 phage head-tail connector protein [Zavarzinia marina]